MYFLKTTSEDSLWEALISAGLAEEVEIKELDQTVTIKAPKQGVTLDVIGSIQKATGEQREEKEGMMVPVYETLEGFHANMLVTFELSDEQQAIVDSISIPAPATPSRVFWI